MEEATETLERSSRSRPRRLQRRGGARGGEGLDGTPTAISIINVTGIAPRW